MQHKLRPEMDNHDRNFPMMFKQATKQEIAQMDSRRVKMKPTQPRNSRKQFANFMKMNISNFGKKRKSGSIRRFSADGNAS